MMHGHGKSDPVIVATKPANNAEPSAAELVEPRTGTKGNVDQQSTCRAQNRENVSQALDRIRQVARQRKKERFTALHHHIDIDLLRTAFLALKRDAAAGVDGLTWKDYESGLERNLSCSKPPCGGKSRAARAQQTGILQLLGLQVHLRQIPAGLFPP
jgi:RNA-directed DNA polymerase